VIIPIAHLVKTQNIHKNSEYWISLASLVVLTLFFCIALFQHGLLFKEEYLTFGGILYAIAAIIFSGGRIPSHPAFYVLVAFVCLYFLVTINAINQQESLSTSFRVAIVLPLLLIAVQLTKEHAQALVRMLVYICSGWVISGVLFNQFREGRFEGSLEYANTWGILLLTALILSLMLFALENKIHYIWLCSLLTSGVILSGSRTVLVLLIVTVPVQYWAFGKGNRKSLPQASIAISTGMINALTYPWSKWAFICSVLIVTLLIIFTKKIQARLLSIAIIPVLLVLTGVILYSIDSILLKRLIQITPRASEWSTRLGYYHDAWLMIKDSPLFGYGGGAWNILQYHYQTAAYSVRYLHNHWLETWIETGVVGVLLFLTLVLMFIWKGLSVYKKAENSTKIWVVGCLSAFGCLLAHSAVDFTFNYSILFGLWVLLGLIIPIHFNDLTPKKESLHTRRPLRILVSLALVILSYISIRLSISESLISQAEQVPNHVKNNPQAIQLLERSTSLAFVSADQHTRVAYLLLKDYLETNNSTHLKRAATEINYALSMNPQDVHVLFLRCQIEYAQGNRKSAELELQELKKQFPFRADIQSELEKWERASATISTF
jgi:O-antigen ligase